jgi:probable blue pigment (indigoidine) exporter
MRYFALVLSNRIGIVLVTALAPAIWGTTYLVTTELLPPGRPLLAAVVRALPVGLALVVLTRCMPRGMWWWRAAVLGILNIGAFFALLFVAAYRLPGGVAATILATQPLLVAGLATGLLGERLSLRTTIAGAAGVAGSACSSSAPMPDWMAWGSLPRSAARSSWPPESFSANDGPRPRP